MTIEDTSSGIPEPEQPSTREEYLRGYENGKHDALWALAAGEPWAVQKFETLKAHYQTASGVYNELVRMLDELKKPNE